MDSLNTILNSGTYGENVSRHNDNNSKIKQAITTLENVAIANKGYFDTLASLQAAFPSPKAGNIAYVANAASSTGYYIYNVVSGVWTATSTEAPAVGVEISNYAQHGYSSSPKTLKQVDDEVVQLAGESLAHSEYVNNSVLKKLSYIRVGLPSGIKDQELYYHTINKKVYRIINSVSVDINAAVGDIFDYKGLPLQITANGLSLLLPYVAFKNNIYYNYVDGVVTEMQSVSGYMGLKFKVKAGDVVCVKTVGGEGTRAYIYKDVNGNDINVAGNSLYAYDIPAIFTCEVAGTVYVNCNPGYLPGVYSLSLLESASADLSKNIDNVNDLSVDFDEIKSDATSVTAMQVGYLISYNRLSIWEQGATNDAGENASSGSGYNQGRIRTKTYIDSRVTRIIAKQGYEFIVYKYDLSGVQVGVAGIVGTSFDLESSFKYRLVLKRSSGSNIPITLDEYVNAYIVSDKSGGQSIYKKNIDFGSTNLSGYYKGLGIDYSAFNSITTTSEVYSAFDALALSSNGYMTKSVLGVCSDGIQNVNLYTLKPPTEPYRMINKIKPKILLLQAQHGFEKSSVFGAYYFIHDLLNKWHEHPILDYIRHHVELQIIPVANPWGFDNNEYKNFNGVNLNRNFLAEGTSQSVTDPSSSQYGGLVAFDQPETQYIRDWVLNNKDALVFIDHHTMGAGKASELGRITWHSYYEGGDDYFNHMFDVANYHICTITANFNKDYNLGNTDNDLLFGFIDSGFGEEGTAGSWVSKQGIIGVTFESFNGFPNEVSAFSNDEKKANSELLGNYLSMILAKYSIVQ